MSGLPGSGDGTPHVPISGGKAAPGKVVSPAKPSETIKEEGPTALLLALLIVVGGLIVILTGLVLAGKLGKPWLDAITSDSEVGLVLTTVYIIAIELNRDRRDREKEQKEHSQRAAKAAVLVWAGLSRLSEVAKSIPEARPSLKDPLTELDPSRMPKPLDLADLFGSLTDLPRGARESTASAYAWAELLRQVLAGAHKRASELVGTPPNDKPWSREMADDTGFVLAYELVADARKELLESTERALPALSKVARSLD